MPKAPTDLPIYRTFRYDGGGFSISLKELAIEDVTRIAQIYQALKSTYDLWLYMGEQVNYDLLRQRLEPFGSTEFMTQVRSVGSASYLHGQPSEMLHSAMHDLRGGALTALTGYARLLSRLGDKPEYIRRAVYLARDHAKMMRNIMPDLDGDLSKLFRGGHTYGGNGIGLSNCASFVATSFGVTAAEALEKGYLRAHLTQSTYYAWFHWPSYTPQSPDEPECDCADH